MKPEVLIVVMIMCGFGMMHNNYKKLAFPVFLLALFIYAGWIPALSKYFIVSEVSQPVEVQSQSQPQTHQLHIHICKDLYLRLHT